MNNYEYFIFVLNYRDLYLMTIQSSSPSTSQQSGSSKILKDFILGGTSGAIAKTLAAPIERVKLLLQTQENNPALRERPYTGTYHTI